MKIGILGCGAMAETFADTLRKMEGAECYAAASRTLERAKKFAREYGFDKAYGSYEELCEDPEVELIYIATPHSCHYENIARADGKRGRFCRVCRSASAV